MEHVSIMSSRNIVEGDAIVLTHLLFGGIAYLSSGLATETTTQL